MVSAREKRRHTFLCSGLQLQSQAAWLTRESSPACFLPSLQASSRFNEGERIRLGAAPGEEKRALCGQYCYLRGLLSYPEGFGVLEVTSKFNRKMRSSVCTNPPAHQDLNIACSLGLLRGF